MSSNDLFILSRHLVSLTSLWCTVDLPQPSRLFFGPALQTLDMELKAREEDDSETADVIGVNDTIVAISRLPTLTDLRLILPECPPTLSFAPLAATAQLQSVTLDSNEGFGALARHQLDQLRMLPHLRKLAVEGLNKDGLESLLRLPHSLQWQELHTVNHIDGALAAALSTLPSLTKLATFICLSVAFLPCLTRLRTLELRMHPSARLAADIAAGLSRCTDLTELTLGAVDVTSAHLRQALSHLPLLRLLQLSRCPALQSLSFLSECTHLAQSLQTFRLTDCRNAALHSSELKHMLSLKKLIVLMISSSFAKLLTAATLQPLQPPSLALPALNSFSYYPK